MVSSRVHQLLHKLAYSTNCSNCSYFPEVRLRAIPRQNMSTQLAKFNSINYADKLRLTTTVIGTAPNYSNVVIDQQLPGGGRVMTFGKQQFNRAMRDPNISAQRRQQLRKMYSSVKTDIANSRKLPQSNLVR